MQDNREEKILKAAVAKWGELQLVKIMEEAGELIQACSRRILGQEDKEHNLEEEIADMEIMLGQAKIIADKEVVDRWKEIKLQKLEKRLKV